MTTILSGPFGHAAPIPIPDDATETLALWLLTCPRWAPLLPDGMTSWTQWVFGCARLRDNVPGLPPPHRKFMGATHEILVLTLDPDHGPYRPDTVRTEGHYLQPQNVVLQFIASDNEMRDLTEIVAAAIVEGRMCPESWRHPGGNQALTADWLTALTKTLAHIRGEEHAP